MSNTEVKLNMKHGGQITGCVTGRTGNDIQDSMAYLFESYPRKVKPIMPFTSMMSLNSKAMRNTFTKIKKQMERKQMCRNWDFTVAHEDMIGFTDITNYVTRENPLAIVEMGCNKDKMLFIHSSLYYKAEKLDMLPQSVINKTVNPDIFLGIQYMGLRSEVIAWAKEVKAAEWGDHKKEVKVTVIVPQI